MSSRAVVVALVLALALLAVGCGGSDDDDADPTAAWASGFCTAVTDWTDALQDVTSQFTDASNLSQDGLQSAADDVKSATQDLVDEVRDLGRPETQGGEQIESALGTLSTSLETETTKIQETAQGVSGLTDLPGAISTITASLTAMGSAFSSALQTVENSDVDGELQSALEDSPECAGID